MQNFKFLAILVQILTWGQVVFNPSHPHIYNVHKKPIKKGENVSYKPRNNILIIYCFPVQVLFATRIARFDI